MESLKLLSKISLSFQELDNFESDMENVLEDIGKSLDISRIYIFLNESKDITNNKFEWCNKGIDPEIENLQNIKYGDVPSWSFFLKRDGYICKEDIKELPRDIVDRSFSKKVKSILVYPLIIENHIGGFMGFDECRYKRRWTTKELEILSTVSGIIANTYERKFFQENIIASESNFRRFFEAMDDILVVSGLNGEIMHCNKSLTDKLGYSLEELKKMDVLDLHCPGKKQEAYEIFESIVKGEINSCPLEVKSKSGHIYEVETRTWIGKWNNRDCIYSVSKDITQEKKREIERMELIKSLEDKCQKLTNIIEGTSLGTWQWNIQTGENIINKQWADTLGYTIEELKPVSIDTWNRLLHPEDRIIANEILQKHIDGDLESYDCECRLRHKDGNWIWIQDRGKIIEGDGDGKPIKMFGTHLDINSRKQAENALKESEKRFNLALNNTRVGLWDYDIVNGDVFLSPMWKEMLGYRDDEIENSFKSWEDLWHPKDKSRIKKAMKDYLDGELKRYEIIHRLKHKDGSWRWILTRGEIINDENKKPYRWIGTNVDITKEQEQALELERFFYVNLDLLCIVDMEGNFIKTNTAWKDILGYSPYQLEGKKIMDFIHPDDIKNTMEALKKLKRNEDVSQFINRYIDKYGNYKYIEWKANPYENILYASGRDVTDHVEYERKILELSNRDELTNISNRRCLWQRGQSLIEEYKRTAASFSLCIIDIDEFKLINDRYGHQTGDSILRKFASVIKANLRPYDIFGRYGGEEFIIILKNTDLKESFIIMDRIREIIKNKNFYFYDKVINYTFSAGIVNSDEIEKRKLDMDILIEIADKRMYHAKTNGRNKVISIDKKEGKSPSLKAIDSL